MLLAGNVFVDGLGVGDVGQIVLRDRQVLAQDGILMMMLTVDKETGQPLAGPDIVSRGFVYMRDSEELLESAREHVLEIVHRFEWPCFRLVFCQRQNQAHPQRVPLRKDTPPPYDPTYRNGSIIFVLLRVSQAAPVKPAAAQNILDPIASLEHMRYDTAVSEIY